MFVVGDGQQSHLPARKGRDRRREVLRGPQRPQERRQDRRRHLPGDPRAEGRRAIREAKVDAKKPQAKDVSQRYRAGLESKLRSAPPPSARPSSAPPAPRPASDWVIVTRGIKREYDMGGEIVHALRGVDLAIRRNEYVAIMGPSGSGKSTLMNLIGCLDTPNAGEYWLNGTHGLEDVGRRSWRACATRRSASSSRRSTCCPRATALHNVELPLVYAGVPVDERKRRAQGGARARAARRPHATTGRTSSRAVSGSASRSRARS